MMNRKGSALLIVLGMLSFMVVSAVGFSVYMRQSRAPSSYLRRNVAARYLVKAALANAIEELEGAYNENRTWGIRENERDSSNPNRDYLPDNHFYGIFDDPYPGCGKDNQDFPNNPKGNGDYWLKRVFCPFGPVREPTSESEASDEGTRDSMANPTVPTLTLEALAYLPPAIADDVRRVSRLTRTACWRPLPYEAGRYAYTVVNVSDLFDINKLMAEPRNSSPNGRISLCSLAGTDAMSPTAIGNEGNLSDATDWTQAAKVGGNVVPWVSLADFALANAGSDYSPFSRFIGSSGDQLLRGGNAAEANSLFVTDTWFPASSGVTTTGGGSGSGSSGGMGANGGNTTAGGTSSVTYDLAGGHQPFKAGAFSATPCPDIFEARNYRNDKDNVGEILEKNLSIGLACLYDYLDRDSQPLSLCLPTTEATPMILGISSPLALRPEIGQIGADENATSSAMIPGTVPDPNGGPGLAAQAKVKRTAKKMGITSFGNNVQIKVMAAYPFKRMKTTGRTNGKDFKLRGVMRIFLGLPGLKSRLSSNAKIPSFANASDWPNGGNANAVVANGVATFFSEEKSLNSLYSSDVKKWEEAIDDSIMLKFSSMNVQMPIYWKVKEEVDTATITPATTGSFTPDNADDCRGEFNSFGNLSTETAALRPFDDAGHFHSGWLANGPWVMTEIGNAACKKADGETVIANDVKFRLQVAVWLQVLDGQKVVDMVPASYVDDEIFLNADNTRGRNENINRMGDGMPLLSFSAATDISYKTIEADLPQQAKFGVTGSGGAALYAVDPRFNWAPEGWWANEQDRVIKATWHDEIENLWGTGGRDRDIFMFVSDQEYLQDIGELQFLPFLQEMNGSGNFNRGDYSPNYHGNPLTAHTTAASAASDFERGIRFLWRTYTAYDNGDGYDPIYALPYNGKDIRIHSGGNGFRLNPYSDDDRVLFAALVGTPFDYYVASTNDDSQVKSSQCRNISLTQMMNTFSFGKSNLAELKDEEIENIGFAIRDTFQGAADRGDSDWEKAWENLMDRGEWQDVALKCDENNKFLGETLGAALHGVDRKFLASFWRECFANRQQLFLVFVRAEPTSVGGGAADAMSSAQLGGRAVALVWRDPSVPAKNIAQRGQRSDYRSLSDSAKEDFRKMKKECPPHRTRILFYHQFD